MIALLRRFLLGVWDFVVGDDPVVAAVVVVAIGLTAALAGATRAAWCLLPVVTLAVLVVSLRRAP